MKEKQSESTRGRRKKRFETFILLCPIIVTIIVTGVTFPELRTFKMVLYIFLTPAISSIASAVVYFFTINFYSRRKLFLSILLPLNIGAILYQLYVIFSFEWIWISPHIIVYVILINALINITLNSILIGYFSQKKVFQNINWEDLT